MSIGNTSHNLRELHRYAKENIPADAPTSLGRMVTITAFVDVSHASNKSHVDHKQVASYLLIGCQLFGVVRDRTW